MNGINRVVNRVMNAPVVQVVYRCSLCGMESDAREAVEAHIAEEAQRVVQEMGSAQDMIGKDAWVLVVRRYPDTDASGLRRTVHRACRVRVVEHVAIPNPLGNCHLLGVRLDRKVPDGVEDDFGRYVAVPTDIFRLPGTDEALGLRILISYGKDNGHLGDLIEAEWDRLGLEDLTDSLPVPDGWRPW